jgi:hypothetical protein
LTGSRLVHGLDAALEARFHAPHPAHAPDDPVERQAFLRAHALVDLVTGGLGRRGRPEFTVVIDHQTLLHGRHQRSRVDCGPGIELPVAVLQDLAPHADLVPVVVDTHGVVRVMGATTRSLCGLADAIARPVPLDAGRTRRFATRAQRRALRAMYRTCVIPGCTVHITRTEPHHLVPWEQGGATDLHQLVPLCRHHHDQLHTHHWQLHLTPDRSLHIDRPPPPPTTTGPPVHHWP